MSVDGRCDECGQDKPDATAGAHPHGGNGAVLCGACRAKLIADLGETEEDEEEDYFKAWAAWYPDTN